MISHYEDFSRVLVSCQFRTCGKVEVWTTLTFKIKIAERKYRPQSPEEFKDVWSKLEHQCCEPAPQPRAPEPRPQLPVPKLAPIRVLVR